MDRVVDRDAFDEWLVSDLPLAEKVDQEMTDLRRAVGVGGG